MSARFKVYIPARHDSSRLPGKPLLEIAGKPMIQHVYERALASGAADVVIATDDERIAAVARRFGAPVCPTSTSHVSGTDRIAEAVAARGEPADQVVVNVQSDEPRMPPAVIRQVAALVGAGHAADIGTVCEPLRGASDWTDPNVVKVVRDDRARALYFSRAAIPHARDWAAAATVMAGLCRRHVGIYAYTAAFLGRFVAMPPHPLEQLERLEQLRALAAGVVIAVPDAVAACGLGVDTPGDYAQITATWGEEA